MGLAKRTIKALQGEANRRRIDHHQDSMNAMKPPRRHFSTPAEPTSEPNYILWSVVALLCFWVAVLWMIFR